MGAPYHLMQWHAACGAQRPACAQAAQYTHPGYSLAANRSQPGAYEPHHAAIATAEAQLEHYHKAIAQSKVGMLGMVCTKSAPRAGLSPLSMGSRVCRSSQGHAACKAASDQCVHLRQSRELTPKHDRPPVTHCPQCV